MKLDHDTYYILGVSECLYTLKVDKNDVWLYWDDRYLKQSTDECSIGSHSHALLTVRDILIKNLSETIRLCQEELVRRANDPIYAKRRRIQACTDIEELRELALKGFPVGYWSGIYKST